MLTEKDYCDYETCVALKELGYDEKCLAYYDSEDNVGLLYNEEYSSAFYPVQYTDLLESHNVRPDGCIDAPTMWEAQKWLREEKKIIVNIDIDYNWYYGIYFSEGNIYPPQFSEGEYGSYEEALSEGIKEAIKILKEE